MNSSPWILQVMIAGLAAHACGPAPSETPSTLQIVGGQKVAPDDATPLRTGTVALTTRAMLQAGKNFCTGTLIAPKIVLTAAHCITDGAGRIAPPATFLVAAGPGLSSASAPIVRSVDGVAVHRGYRADLLRRGISPETTPMNDLALVRLAEGLPIPMAVVPLALETDPAAAGTTLALAGYGVSATRAFDDVGTLRHVAARVVRSGTTGRVLVLRGPRLNASARVPGPDGRMTTVPANGGACAADSGGPAYAKSANGTWRVIGVTSYGDELPLAGRFDGTRYCVGESSYVDVRSYLQDLRLGVGALGDARISLASGRHLRFSSTDALIASE